MVTPMAIKILAVDDSKTIRMVIQGAFRTYDCALSEAANGEEGLALAAREKPDLIILDIEMPVMDGVTMLGTLRRDPQLKATPVILLSADSSRENVASMVTLGISDYLVKPFKEDTLLDAVRKVVPLAAKSVYASKEHEVTETMRIPPRF
jgi:two-component system cell cycle response regulator